ncbi:hypothetical protein PL11_005700 [Lentilactobacillus curieae]|uniref:PTS EIIA type-4 domain-containing protein n=1 Tax=Lentilactobacillus curieae TaxID=1138822 RepID=A0A1S6QIM6_9LACO|nr:hypothetical protein [Lentilactobacillus curieae]AQW21462.1 hypothetical protein PL11_005700 [Lentilactobacillus curieae]
MTYDEAVTGKGIETSLLSAIKHDDVVIVMLDSMSHKIANQAFRTSKDLNKLVSSTNVNSPLAIEESIKRALNREPIYTSANHIVD